MELIGSVMQDLVLVRYVIYANEKGFQKFRELAVSNKVKAVSAVFSTKYSAILREIGLLHCVGERNGATWSMDLTFVQQCEFRSAQQFCVDTSGTNRFVARDHWMTTLGLRLPTEGDAATPTVPVAPTASVPSVPEPVAPITNVSALPEPIKRLLPVSAELLERPAQDLSDQELKDAKLAITLVIEQLQAKQEELTDMQQSRAKDKRAQLLANKAELEAQLAAIEEEERLLKAEMDASNAVYAM